MDLHEEVKNDQEPGAPAGNDYSSVLLEDVETENVEENKEINQNDFVVESLDIDPAKEEEKKNVEIKPDVKPEPETKKDAPVNTQRNAAVTRLMKPQLMMTFTNMLLGRAGAIIKPDNPDFLKLNKPDREDLGVIMGDAVQEGNWGGVPAKWLLLGLVILIIAGKIWNRNKKADTIETEEKKEIASGAASADIQKLIARFDEHQKETRGYIDELKEQNRFLKELLDKKLERGMLKEKPGDADHQERFYKGHDLSKIEFTEKGAFIDPSKAGKKGYSPRGAKMGIPSEEEKDLYFAWKRYQEFMIEDAA